MHRWVALAARYQALLESSKGNPSPDWGAPERLYKRAVLLAPEFGRPGTPTAKGIPEATSTYSLSPSSA